jgi:solute carrier family 8 (sodium/calcium exchanger)
MPHKKMVWYKFAFLLGLIPLASCIECVGDTLLPLLPGETDYHSGLRAVFYFIGMCYLFLGISISADKFMEAIGVITSKTKALFIAGEKVEVLVWNETVANLTLMALGSSAPEILLAIIETVSLGFEAGELGPGTIVGSAAFNLLLIIAICIVAIPPADGQGETGFRRIKEVGVFVITASFSLFAYLWMYLVLTVISPDEIELWEALVTLAMFPVLVLMAYLVDRKY